MFALVGVTLAVLAWRPLARWTGWAPGWTLVSLVVLVGVLALTLSPSPDFPRPRGVRSCLREASAEMTGNPLAVLGSAEALLNLVLLVPLGLAVVLATRRLGLATALVIVLPAAVEITQTQVSGRLCSGSDYATNVTGGLAGVVLGAVTLGAGLLLRRSRT